MRVYSWLLFNESLPELIDGLAQSVTIGGRGSRFGQDHKIQCGQALSGQAKTFAYLAANAISHHRRGTDPPRYRHPQSRLLSVREVDSEQFRC